MLSRCITANRNIDHLFDLNHGAFYAALDCYGGRKSEEECAACPCFHWDANNPNSAAADTPLLGSWDNGGVADGGGVSAPRQRYFNAGMFVFSPDPQLLQHFMQLLRQRAAPIGGFAEQDFLNWCAPDA